MINPKIDEYTVWVGLTSPLVKIGLAKDCWTSYIVFPSAERKTWDWLNLSAKMSGEKAHL